MVVYGYLRVSTEKQTIDNYKNEIRKLADEKELGMPIWIQETVSGRKDWRKRELGKVFETMKSGDIIIMAEYSRIGRDFLQSMEFLAECKRKNILVFSTIGDVKLDNTPESNLLLSITAWKAQVDREQLSYRTKIGIRAHKLTGSKFGRRPEMILDKDEKNKKKICEMLLQDIKLKSIAKQMNTTTTTLRKFIKKHNLKQKIRSGDEGIIKSE